jgi:type I site-specific restriction endonuclease
VREEIRKKLENIDGAIIFGTYPILSTGVNVKNLKYLVLGSSTKSETRIPQSIGRLMRLHKSKDKVTIFDIVDDLTYYKSKKSKNLVKNRVFKHWEERLSLYLEYEFNLSETNVMLK